MRLSNPVYFLLRVGVAFALLYPPFAALGDPVSWASYFPPFVRTLPIETTTLLNLFGVVELVLALWILSGWKIRIPALVTAVLLIAIVAFNWGQFPVLFRDLSIAAMALALALWPPPNLPEPEVPAAL
jgi:uncharacterized membrane protein YphA (DoxX/SURF4 family)